MLKVFNSEQKQINILNISSIRLSEKKKRSS